MQETSFSVSIPQQIIDDAPMGDYGKKYQDYLAGMVRMRELNEMLLTYLPCELTQEKEEQGNQEKQENAKMEKSIFTLMEIDIQTGLSYCMNDTNLLGEITKIKKGNL